MSEELAFQHFPLSTAERDAAEMSATAVTASTGDISGAIWTMKHPYCVTRVGVQIGTAVVYGSGPTSCVVAIDRRVINGSDTGRVELGRVTIPESAPAGKVYYVDVPTSSTGQAGDCITGDQLVAEVITQGVGGTGTGTFRPRVWGHVSTEINAVQLDGSTTPVQMMVQDTTTVQV